MADTASFRRKVAVIACGGTIGSVSRDALDVIDYPEHGEKVRLAELLQSVPDAQRIADIQEIDFRGVSSSAIGPAEWFELRSRMIRLADSGIDGIVILHGTGTLEETAFFLHLTWPHDVPVVLTGAQRPLSAVSSDAGMNLISALRVAADPASSRKCVMVVLNDEIFPARDATKTSTLRLQTFQAPNLGPIGYVDGDGVVFRRASLITGGMFSDVASRSGVEAWPRVDIIYSYAGADGAMVDAAVAAGARGIVCAGFAAGLATPAQQDRLDAAHNRGIVIIQSSRSTGRIARRRALRERGTISSEDLGPQKARILLSLCFLAGFEHEQISTAFHAS
jgi:L-asparaginase